MSKYVQGRNIFKIVIRQIDVTQMNVVFEYRNIGEAPLLIFFLIDKKFFV